MSDSNGGPPHTAHSTLTPAHPPSQALVQSPYYASLPSDAKRAQDNVNSVAQMLFQVERLRWYFIDNGFTGATHQRYSRLFTYMMSPKCEHISNEKTTQLVPGEARSDAIVQGLLSTANKDGVTSRENAQRILTQVLKSTVKEANTIPDVPNTTRARAVQLENGDQAWYYFCNFMDNTLVSHLFTVQIDASLTHHVCGHKSYNRYWYKYIRIDLSSSDEMLSLKYYLDVFMAQQITFNRCTRCNRSLECTRKNAMSRHPPYLLIYLHRFAGSQEKFNRWVDIDERLELGSQTYELVSVIIHKGTVAKGIYWTVIRERSYFWVVIANERIIKGLTNAQAKELVKRFALVMMYKRVGDDESLVGNDDDIYSGPSPASVTNQAQPPPPPPVQHHDKHPYCGLLNFQFVCYSNSVLQALYTCAHVRAYIVSHPNSGRFHGLLSELYTEMGAQSTLFNDPKVDPESKFNREFRSVRPEFIRRQMHDAQEYMAILLELVHQESNQAKRSQRPEVVPEMTSAEQAWAYHQAYVDSSELSKLFMGQVESVLSCVACGQSSKTWYAIWQLQLHLEEEDSKNKEQSKKGLNLMDCIDEFTSVETLNELPCTSCNSRQSFHKKQSIHRHPHYLLIHLKRFTFTGEKIRRTVQILEQFYLTGQSYVLSSVVCHTGNEHFGHYYTIVGEGTDQWVKLDDDSIRRQMESATAHALLEGYAYLCIYELVPKKDEMQAKEEGQSK